MKKGFTLIELLAVIVILAIIALIATPIVLNIINDSKTSAQKRSKELYVDAIEQMLVTSQMDSQPALSDGVYKINSDGSLVSNDNKNIFLNIDRPIPTGGYVVIEDSNIVWYDLQIENESYPMRSYTPSECFKTRELDDKTIAIVGFDNSCEVRYTDLVIPSYLDDKLVTEIGGLSDRSLKNVIIPNTIITIKDGAFYQNSIEELIIPSSVKVIEQYAFGENQNLKKITLSEGLQSIGYGAFGITGITEVVIPSSTTIIGEKAFHDTYWLNKVIIHNNRNNVTLGEKAFGNFNLENIEWTE